ncbi:MAG: ATP-dependent DNA ligase [Actinobacteria bacterium]|nr:ATP-dependent DNA ligase [Actinomycetota bacterium]MCA1722468.1 ATP-dependent DNA ligase [Actinomycetota bacterium]
MAAVVPPIEPMLAQLARTLPEGDDLSYEPKWDGFRCLSFGGDLHSRNERPLTRYFPEVVDALAPLGDVVLDGELVSAAGFVPLMARLHPAASRVALLAEQTPATYVAFDVLAVGDEDLQRTPFVQRRSRLEQLVAGTQAQLTTTTRDAAEAAGWLTAPSGSGIDGVMVKDDGLLYEPGRRAMVKVKHLRTADCVVGGVRVHADGGVGSMLLGCWDGDVLRHVGVAASLAKALRQEVRAELAPLVTSLQGHPWEQGFGVEGGALGRLKGTGGRWVPGMTQDWLPVRPERVAEVSYDHVEGWKFRHPGRFVRWRLDRDPRSCTVEQLT